MESLMTHGIHHLGYVYADVDKAIDDLRSLYDIESFARYDFAPQYAWYKGEPVEGFSLNIGMLQVGGGCTMELIQPPMNVKSHFRDFLESGKKGLHHVCFSTDKFTQWRDYLDELGREVLFQVQTEDDKIGFRRGAFFFDPVQHIICEIREIPHFRK